MKTWVNLILAFLDVSATYLMIYLLKKKNAFHYKMEKSPIHRFIINKVPSLTSAYFVSLITNMVLFVLISFLISDILFGMLVVVNFYHYNILMELYKNWNNDKYWRVYKIRNEVKAW